MSKRQRCSSLSPLQDAARPIVLVALGKVDRFLRCSCQDLVPFCFPLSKWKCGTITWTGLLQLLVDVWQLVITTRPIPPLYSVTNGNMLLPGETITNPSYSTAPPATIWVRLQGLWHFTYLDNGHTLGCSGNTSANDPSHPACPAPRVKPNWVLSVTVRVRLQLGVIGTLLKTTTSFRAATQRGGGEVVAQTWQGRVSHEPVGSADKIWRGPCQFCTNCYLWQNLLHIDSSDRRLDRWQVLRNSRCLLKGQNCPNDK